MNRKSGHMRAGLRRRVRADTARRSTRRKLIIAAAAWPALAFTGAVFGQSAKPPVLIGWLNSGSRERDASTLGAFKEGMAALGWKEGANYALEERWAEGQLSRLPTLAAKASPDIPVVHAAGTAVLARGLAKSLARPGGMVTGVTNIASDLSEKKLELLLAAAPKLKRIGFLADATSPVSAAYIKTVPRAAEHFRVEVRVAEAAKAEELEGAISRLAKEGVQALVVSPSGWFPSERARIVKLALAHRWPVIAGSSVYAQEGALLSYGVDRLALYRRSAYYVDRILKGAKPGDLPIEQPTKFELVLNMKTAKALGLEIPREFAVRVDRVIE
ncbi:MAG: ABC transporter substrate-binding protein [Betaproteobacteria bacterium]|nr:ABC transporter substrate-binding protein [Betaproteobacteria bacterium]